MSNLRIVFDGLPPHVRIWFYAAFEALGYLLAAAEAAALATGHHWWPLTAAVAAYGFFSGRVHALARNNVPKRPKIPEQRRPLPPGQFRHLR